MPSYPFFAVVKDFSPIIIDSSSFSSSIAKTSTFVKQLSPIIRRLSCEQEFQFILNTVMNELFAIVTTFLFSMEYSKAEASELRHSVVSLLETNCDFTFAKGEMIPSFVSRLGRRRATKEGRSERRTRKRYYFESLLSCTEQKSTLLKSVI